MGARVQAAEIDRMRAEGAGTIVQLTGIRSRLSFVFATGGCVASMPFSSIRGWWGTTR